MYSLHFSNIISAFIGKSLSFRAKYMNYERKLLFLNPLKQ